MLGHKNVNFGHSARGQTWFGQEIMNKGQTFLILLALPLFPYPCLGQGMLEFGGKQASMAGMGAGLAASLNHGKVIRNSYQAAANAQQAVAIQTKAIEQYMKVGCEQETKRNGQMRKNLLNMSYE